MTRTTSKHSTKLSYAISYGLGGGPLHARQLERQLRRVGLRRAGRLDRADIIIAHSGGCWLIPPSAKPKLVIYIGMPLAQAAPHRTLVATSKLAFQKGGIKHRLKNMAKSMYYNLSQPGRNRDIIRRAKTAQPIVFPGVQSVFVANRYDPWPKSEALQTYLAEQPWAFVGLSGPHDDIWHHSGRYAAIINHYARLLA